MSLGFYFDMTRCTGCKTCQVACKDRLNLQKAGPRPRRIDTYECGKYPDVGLFHMAVSCNHCENPACVTACPVGAMSVSDDGTVQHDDNLCVACLACISACPYESPQYSEDENIVVKCDTCKPLREAGMNPVCADSCPMRALDFGEMDMLKAKYGDKLINEIPCLPSADITNPRMLVKAKETAFRNDFKEVTL